VKLIKCIIQENKLETVKQTMIEQGVQGLTIYEVKGYGIHRAQLEHKASGNYLVEFQPRVMLELVVNDQQVNQIVTVLTAVIRTGRLGDGKIFVLPVEEAVRIRTSERGAAVL
jgi:nitrogen regulatory protein P-II 1